MNGLLTNNNWQILYNYAAQPGQSWQNNISAFCSTPTALAYSYTVTVDSIKNVNVSGFNLKRLYVKYWRQFNVPSPVYEPVQITERFGCSQFLFNFYNKACFSDADDFAGFLCYTDNDIGLQKFTNKPCDYRDAAGIAENYQNDHIKILPNPADNSFNIEIENEMLSGQSLVRIGDLSGRIVKQVYIGNVNSKNVDVSGLGNGAYILQIINNNKAIYTGKLVKAN